MTFTSLTFALFLPVVFSIYWYALGRNFKAQNVFLLAVSYIFYGWWDWRFLGLILLTTLLSYGCALPQNRRKAWATLSVVINLLILCIFKYYNFFCDNLRQLLATFGYELDWFTMEVLLPVGISFYTFQAISYSVDAYRRRIEPTRDIIAFGVFIAFFPQLVAGPIERSTQLLPQFLKPRQWNHADATEGLRMILWGLFKKCVVADGVAFWVDTAYTNHVGGMELHNGFWCMVGAIGFALQIYGDFSGYSDIAKGSAKLLGIRLMDNFLYPFFSRNAIELWHRWHRSLMQWFTEYVYIPLGGSRRGNKYVNVMAVFLLSGLWHGAEWSFIAWGAVCGLWYVAAAICGARKYKVGINAPASRRDMMKISSTFFMFVIVFIFFRAKDIGQALDFYRSIWLAGPVSFVLFLTIGWILAKTTFNINRALSVIICLLAICCIVVPKIFIPDLLAFLGYVFGLVMLWAEWRARSSECALGRVNLPRRRSLRLTIYALLYLFIATGSLGIGNDFIYFKF